MAVRATWISVPVLLLLAAAARADVVVLKDGRLLEGRRMERTDGGVKVEFENGTVTIPLDRIHELVIENDAGWVPATEEEKEKAAKGLVNYDGKWMTPEKRADLVAERIAKKKEEVEELKRRSEWRNRWQEKTKHFEFESTLPPHVFEYYRDLMEAYFTQFAKDWKVGQPADLGRLKVCLYATFEEFQRTGGVSGGVQGYFRFVKPLELNFYYNRGDPEYTTEVMFHETNHYLQKLLNVEFSMPHFPGESLAEYYAGSSWDGEKRKLTQNLLLEGRLTEVKTDLAAGKTIGLQKLVTTDGMYEHYTWGWSLVYYLMNDRRYEKKFQKFILTLAHGRDVKREREGYGAESLTTVKPEEVWRIFRDHLGLKTDEDVAKLEAEWHEYVKKIDVASVRGLESAAEAAYNTGRRIRATRLFKEAIEAGSRNPLVHMTYGQLLSGSGKKEEALAALRKAVELDPLNARCWGALGRTLALNGQKEEGERLLLLAREIDPYDVDLETALTIAREALDD